MDEFIKKYCSGDLEFTPRSKFKYNNSGYFLLGAIIEKVTGKAYEEVLKENILIPLNLMNTGYDKHAPIIEKRAAGYEKTFDGFENSAYLDMSIPYAAGSLYSTVEDLYLWDQALSTDQLLSTKFKQLIFTTNLNNYGYGWVIQQKVLNGSKDSIKVISHGGGINGFNTLIVRLIEDKSLIVLLNNTGGTKLNEMSKAIVNILYNKPYDMPKKSIAETLYNMFKNKDIDAAVKQYYLLKEKQSAEYDFGESELNRLGYQ